MDTEQSFTFKESLPGLILMAMAQSRVGWRKNITNEAAIDLIKASGKLSAVLAGCVTDIQKLVDSGDINFNKICELTASALAYAQIHPIELDNETLTKGVREFLFNDENMTATAALAAFIFDFAKRGSATEDEMIAHAKFLNRSMQNE